MDRMIQYFMQLRDIILHISNILINIIFSH